MSHELHLVAQEYDNEHEIEEIAQSCGATHDEIEDVLVCARFVSQSIAGYRRSSRDQCLTRRIGQPVQGNNRAFNVIINNPAIKGLIKVLKSILGNKKLRSLLATAIDLARRVAFSAARVAGGIASIIGTAGLGGDVVVDLVIATLETAASGFNVIANAMAGITAVSGIDLSVNIIPFNPDHLDEIHMAYRNRWLAQPDSLNAARQNMSLISRAIYTYIAETVAVIGTWVSVIVPDDAGIAGEVIQWGTYFSQIVVGMMSDAAVLEAGATTLRTIDKVYRRMPLEAKRMFGSRDVMIENIGAAFDVMHRVLQGFPFSGIIKLAGLSQFVERGLDDIKSAAPILVDQILALMSTVINLQELIACIQQT
jgi:hypothetical protein